VERRGGANGTALRQVLFNSKADSSVIHLDYGREGKQSLNSLKSLQFIQKIIN
jgi:hypothetical protein